MEATAAAAAAGEKAAGKLKAAIEAGDLYSALQLLKTQTARAKKKGDFAQAIELARGGATTLLEKGQCNEGADLAREFVELLKLSCAADASGVGKPDADRVKQIIVLDVLFGGITTEEAARERMRFIKMAIEYTAECGLYPEGEPALHRVAASTAIKSKDFARAARHLLHAHNPQELSMLVVRWAKTGPVQEYDLHCTRTVLQLLCVDNLKDANAFFKLFQEALPLTEPSHQPLVHFTGFLLRTLERDAYPVFKTLREKYAPALARTRMMNPTFDQYLDRIALNFFNVKPAGGGMGSLLDMLMKSS